MAWIILKVSQLALAPARKHTAHGAGQDIEQMDDKIQEKTQ
jgi:hypothetical protein